jgi:adenylate kinase
LGLQNRQQLKEISTEQLEDIRVNIFPKFFSSYKDLVVDGHLNLNQGVVDCFDSFVSMEASSEKILSNRQSEPKRDRSLDLEKIDQEISSYKTKLDSMTLRFSIKPVILHNEGIIKDLSDKLYSVYLDLEKDQEIKSEIYRNGKEF